MSDYDNPWKEALEAFLELFLRFFFRAVYSLIDWSRPVREPGYDSAADSCAMAELGPRLADKLFKVWLKDGTLVSLLIHIEVQKPAG